jgi:hypothetical protein
MNTMWSLSATAYTGTGPKRIRWDSPVFQNLFHPLHNVTPGAPFKGNIINVDFFENTGGDR